MLTFPKVAESVPVSGEMEQPLLLIDSASAGLPLQLLRVPGEGTEQWWAV